MAYNGAYVFTDKDDFMEESSGYPKCRCCGKAYEEDEPVCECNEISLRELIESPYEIIRLSKEGRIILERLREINGLSHITEIDVCRLSELANLTFTQLMYIPINDWVVYLVKAWSANMLHRANKGDL